MSYGWTKDEQGNISVRPLMGYDLMIAETALGIRLVYEERGDPPQHPSGNLQLVLKPNQAIKFAQDILSAAGKIGLTGPSNPS